MVSLTTPTAQSCPKLSELNPAFIRNKKRTMRRRAFTHKKRKVEQSSEADEDGIEMEDFGRRVAALHGRTRTAYIPTGDNWGH